MKPKDPKQVPAELLSHLASFESRGGLMRMNARVSLRRLTRKWAIAGAGVAKRGLDVIGSGAALLALSPILTAAAILVRLDGGPVIFVQTRVGRHGRTFKMFKFRSMRTD